jgi:hypothetical protein
MPLKGATTTFSVGTAVANITSINGWTEELEAVARGLLGDAIGAHEKFCPGDRIQHGPLEMETEFDPDVFTGSGNLKTLGATVTGTLQFPDPTPGSGGGATLAGTGFLKGRGFNGVEVDQVIKGTVMFQFDGAGTPPAWTAST